MHIQILTGASLRQQPALQQSILRHRHQTRDKTLGQTAVQSPRGQQIDTYDTDEAVHFVVFDPDGTIAAYSRLIVAGKTPISSNGDKVRNWTLLTAPPRQTTSANAEDEVAGLGISISRAGRLLCVAVVEWALANGVSELVLPFSAVFTRMMVEREVADMAVYQDFIIGERQREAKMGFCLKEKTAFSLWELFGPGLGALGDVGGAVERARL